MIQRRPDLKHAMVEQEVENCRGSVQQAKGRIPLEAAV
jgi:hypothetical protein